MNNGILFILIIFILAGCGAKEQKHYSPPDTNAYDHANDTLDELEAQFTIDIANYNDAFNKRDWNKLMSMMNPKLFDMLPKEQMINNLNKLNSVDMQTHTNFNKVDNRSKVIRYDNLKFCRVYYSGEMISVLSGSMLSNALGVEEELGKYYGSENVEFDRNTREMIVNVNKSMIATSKIASNDWKYLEYNEEETEVLNMLVPEEVLIQIRN